MKFKEILPLALTTVVVMSLFNYFWSPSVPPAASCDYKGQRYKAPTQQEAQWMRPVDTSFRADETLEHYTSIQTPLASYTFSDQFAALHSIVYHRDADKSIQAFSAPSAVDQLLNIALNNEIINNFVLDSSTHSQGIYKLVYKAKLKDKACTKEFTIHENSYVIEANITLEGEHSNHVKIMMNSPYLEDVDKQETLQFFSNTSVHLEPIDASFIDCYWVKPEMIGFSDRYFVHGLLKDTSEFVDRAYLKHNKDFPHCATLVFESIAGAQGSWNFSFYMGPKDHPSLASFDKKLENTLNYGYLSFITKPLSQFFCYILNMLKSYSINYGLGIIILVIILRAFMALCGANSLALQGSKNKEQIDKENQEVEQRYKHDKKALIRAKFELTKKHGKPALLGVAALLLQIPFFLSLSWLLSNSLDFYKTPFLWVPDLSMPDPYYIFSVLLLLAFAAQALVVEDKKQRSSMIMMALFMGFFSSRFCAGTALYIFVGMVLMIIPMLYKKMVKQ